MQIDDPQSLRLSMPEFLHQQPDFDNLLGALGIHRFIRLVDRGCGFPSSALECQPVPSEIHQNPSHGAAREGIKMLPASDMPAALVDVAQPNFVNQLGGRDWRHVPFPSQMLHGYLAELWQDLSQHLFGQLAVACRKRL